MSKRRHTLTKAVLFDATGRAVPLKTPIRLRLIRDSTRLCEVSDAGSTPHLRRARAFDGGGRGLLLVARHARQGKTVWAKLGEEEPVHRKRVGAARGDRADAARLGGVSRKPACVRVRPPS